MFRKSLPLALATALLTATPSSVYAQQSGTAQPTAGKYTVQELPALPLYEGQAPDSPRSAYQEQTVKLGSAPMIANVSSPTLTPVLPPKEISNGTAVIIAPGGGYYILSFEEEGMRQARWLAERGFTAFVLKYRTRPFDVATLPSLASRVVQEANRPGADVYKLMDYKPPVADGAMAIRTIRTQAEHWGVDPHRIVFMGFSAGAFTTLKLATSASLADRPDFAVPVYPSLEALPVPKGAPPMFLAIALDDELFRNKGFGLLTAWQASGSPFEAHLFERGGHGFGMGAPGTTTMDWMNDLHAWFKLNGLTSRAPQAARTSNSDGNGQ